MELVKYISKEFQSILYDIDWMDKGTKIQAKEKVNPNYILSLKFEFVCVI